MPGITLVADESGVSTDDVGEAMGSVTFFEDDGARLLHDGSRTVVAASGYDEYPIRVVETDDAKFVLEGRLYDVDDVTAAVRTVGNHLLAGRDEAVAEWNRTTDGDFLLVAIDRASERARVLVDQHARLPVYVVPVGSATVVSRELKFLKEFADAASRPLSFDRLGVAQTLTFGYRLGMRTLYEGVRRIPPATVATVDDGVDGKRLDRHDFSEWPHADRSLSENAAALADLFTEACRNRGQLPGGTVLGLSGGLDSRAVAAGLDRADELFRAATFDLPNGGKADEVRAARGVAEELDVGWERHVAAESENHRDRLLEIKQGMTYLRLSFLLDFLEGIAEERGSVTYVSGDGGDKVLPDLRPRALRGEDELLSFLFESEALFDPGEAARIAGIGREDLVESVRERFRAYPESEPDHLYTHFQVRERGMNWLFQGEDRNRYYHWTVTPFYARRVFQYAMGVPPQQKAGGKLRREFLAELAPGLLDVEYANYGAPVNSTQYRLKRSVEDVLDRHPTVGNAVVAAVSNLKNDTMGDARMLSRQLQARIDEGIGLHRVVDPSEAERVAGDPAAYSERQLYHLLTLVSLPGRQ